MLQKQIRVALADDHKIFRNGIKVALADKQDLEIIWEAKDGKDLMSKISVEIPDVLVMDISMPEVTGMEAIKMLRKENNDIKIIVLSSFNDEQTVGKMMELGANAYLTKTVPPTEIYEAIVSCVNEGYYFNSLVNISVIRNLIHKKSSNPSYSRFIPVKFEEREIKILQLLAEDKTAKEISKLVFLSHRTVETIRQKMKDKVSVRTIGGLITYGIRNTLIN
jgi:DNA-binding NarL/FixJ family response regulator